MGGGYRSPRSWMISISTGITTTPILDNTLVVTLTLSRSIILKSNSSTFYISIASVHGRLHLGQSSDPTLLGTTAAKRDDGPFLEPPIRRFIHAKPISDLVRISRNSYWGSSSARHKHSRRTYTDSSTYTWRRTRCKTSLSESIVNLRCVAVCKSLLPCPSWHKHSSCSHKICSYPNQTSL